MKRFRRISDETAAVLKLFLSAPLDARYGREIVLDTELKSGSLYPILHRLEQWDLLQSDWEELELAIEEKRRPRRLYRLRRENVARAESLVRQWEEARKPARPSAIGGELPA